MIYTSQRTQGSSLTFVTTWNSSVTNVFFWFYDEFVNFFHPFTLTDVNYYIYNYQRSVFKDCLSEYPRSRMKIIGTVNKLLGCNLTLCFTLPRPYLHFDKRPSVVTSVNSICNSNLFCILQFARRLKNLERLKSKIPRAEYGAHFGFSFRVLIGPNVGLRM